MSGWPKGWPVVADDDKGEVRVTIDGKTVRSWTYAGDDERRLKMLAAREWQDGYHAGMAGAKGSDPSDPTSILGAMLSSFTRNAT